MDKDDDDDEGMTTGRVGSRGANVMPRRFSRETIRDATRRRSIDS